MHLGHWLVGRGQFFVSSSEQLASVTTLHLYELANQLDIFWPESTSTLCLFLSLLLCFHPFATTLFPSYLVLAPLFFFARFAPLWLPPGTASAVNVHFITFRVPAVWQRKRLIQGVQYPTVPSAIRSYSLLAKALCYFPHIAYPLYAHSPPTAKWDLALVCTSPIDIQKPIPVEFLFISRRS